MAGRIAISFAASAVSDMEGILSYYDGEGIPAAGKSLVAALRAKSNSLQLTWSS